MSMKATLTLRRFDKNYRLLEEKEQPSRSWVLNFLRILYVMHAQIQSGAPYSMPDITNTAQNVASNAWNDTTQKYEINNLAIGSQGGGGSILIPYGNNIFLHRDHLDSENIGIVIGTGVGAVTPTDFALGTQIAHGRVAGQMEYGGCDVAGFIITHPNGQFTIRRFFENNSGGGITVEEVGIYASGCGGYPGGNAPYAWPFCIARDLTGGVAVADTELLEATYTVQITV
jgi:hypothetical protein